MSEQNSKADDYALAKYLDERIAAIFVLVTEHYSGDLPDLSGINRSYVLLVHEVKQLYDRNPELSSIKRNICWRTFRTVDIIDPYTLSEYSIDYPTYEMEHISEVNSLCIIAGKTEPDITPTLQKILDEADKNVAAFTTELDKMNAMLSFESISVPVVTIGSTKYRLSSMRDGLAHTIISYCFEKHPNRLIDLKTLKSELKAAKITAHGLTNLRDDIRNSHFGEKNPLGPFVTASSKAILVRRSTPLTEQQIDAIKAACKQLFSE